MFRLNPIQPALDVLAHLVDVPASLSHLIREAQVDALIAQHSRPTTLAGLAARAEKVSTFMGQANFFQARDHELSLRQALHLIYRGSLESAEAYRVVLSPEGETWITAMTFRVEEGDVMVLDPDRIGPVTDGEATVKVTWLEDHWSVEVVAFEWVTPRLVDMLHQVLGRFHPDLRLSDAQVAELNLDAIVPAREAFIRLIDVPEELSSLSRPRQLAALRKQYARATSLFSLEMMAIEHAVFMGAEVFSEDTPQCDAFGCKQVQGDDEVSWSVSLDGQVILTCAGLHEDGDRCELSVRVTPRDGSWTVKVEESEYPLRALADRINELLRRFHPRLKLTARQLARIEFYD